MARRRVLGVPGAGSGVAAIAASLGGFRSTGAAVGETSGGEMADMAHPAAAHPVGGTATLHVD